MHKRIMMKKGDIIHLPVDAIVNAARASLRPGGGVSGAIHRAAGPKLKKLCQQQRHQQGSCQTGRAVITDAGNLPSRKVIHAVGPVWWWGWRATLKQSQLACAYQNSLLLAVEHGLQTIAFPAISTGHYHFPRVLAARIAITTVRDFLKSNHVISQVIFVCFKEKDAAIYRAALDFYLIGENDL
ncbi:macro domain-containing protein [Arsenophonus apicola]|uniref:macro domain-containing protein n=1 Tax=Arsenophonus apicola TaxID=2879119 RepID=UPI0038794161